LIVPCLTQKNWDNALRYLERLLDLALQQDADLRAVQENRPVSRDLEVIYGLLMVGYAYQHRLELARRRYEQYQQRVGADAIPRALQDLARLIEGQHLSTLRGRQLIDEAVHQIKGRMEPRLRDALWQMYLTTGACTAPGLSQRCQQMLHRAEEEATSYGDTMVGTPHLTLALCTALDASDATVEESLPVPVATLEHALRAVLGDRTPGLQRADRPTLALQRLLQIATDRAATAGAAMVDVPHLWLALLQEKDTLLSRVLAQAGTPHTTVLERLETALEDYQA
jgi:hypothetical protein